MSSHINKLLRAGKWEAAIEKAAKYKDIFSGRFYIEIQAHPAIADLKELTKLQIKLARELDLPLVATNDVHYLKPEDARAQDALLCVLTRN